jgi:hypothetical protein
MTPREELTAAQTALVAALVAGGAPPPGFDAARVEAAARALMRKRVGEIARAWPRLAAGYGSRWVTVFAEWAYGRPTRGSWLDGWEFARAHRASLPGDAALELLLCEAAWRYDERTAPQRRRVFAARTPGGVLLGLFGHTRVVMLRPGHRT